MEQINISKRLGYIAELIEKTPNHLTVADVGTDHGYLPIYLVRHGISSRVIAMDVRKEPLLKAQKNVNKYNVEQHIELRLSDGLDKLKLDEAQVITICGMGGKLMKRIIKNGFDKLSPSTRLILSPQSEIAEFKKYLCNAGIIINKQHMIKDDKQYYLILECSIGNGDLIKSIKVVEKDDILTELDFRYGLVLLREKNDCLYEMLLHELSVNKKVYEKVINAPANSKQQGRVKELEYDIKCIEKALEFYE